eukprot:TRINITY_DN771_c2_g1_i1.p1 TRINITY_DN771_c2_g1~~TRINITY_DN771_c2_g1_i1.p1  ORF type:complete len:427 (+),score=94.35 TRINITY_DN771_c2_g1_i1:52-1332(+)
MGSAQLEEYLQVHARLVDSLYDDFEVVCEAGDATPGVLGTGASGRVLRCETIKPNARCPRHVAVKHIRKDAIVSPRKLERLEGEIAALQRADHENIIRLYEVVHDSASVYLVTERFEEGCDLFQYLHDVCTKKRSAPSSAEAATLVAQILAAVAYLHERGIVHRDIKADNVLVDPKTLDVRLIDFGFAMAVPDDDTARVATAVCGTESYLSLEALQYAIEKREYTAVAAVKRNDVYAVGVVAYSLMALKLPYKSMYHSFRTRHDPAHQLRSFKYLHGLLQKDLTRGAPYPAPKSPEAISGAAHEVIAALLNHDAAARPAAGEALRSLAWFSGTRAAEESLTVTLSVAAPLSSAKPSSCSPGGAAEAAELDACHDMLCYSDTSSTSHSPHSNASSFDDREEASPAKHGPPSASSAAEVQRLRYQRHS